MIYNGWASWLIECLLLSGIDISPEPQVRVQPIGLRHYFSLALGVIVGVGWIAVLGSWLTDAGPVGAIIAFVVGGLLLLPVGLCYAELGGRYPVNGGVVFYVYKAFGRNAAFFMGWVCLVSFLTALMFFTLTMAWLFEVIAPGLRGPILYSIRGANVTSGGVATAVAATALLAYVNAKGGLSSARFQEAVLVLLFVIAAVFVATGIVNGDPSNLRPYFEVDRGSILPGIGAVLVTTPWFLSGFEAIAQGFGEKKKSISVHGIGAVIVCSIMGAVVFYAFIIIGAGLVAPRDVIVSAELPVEAAFRIGLDSTLLAKAVLIAGMLGLLTSWNGLLFACIRIFSTMGEAGFIWKRFASKKHFPAPLLSVLVSSAIGLIGVFLGKHFLEPLINAGALTVGVIFLCVALALLRLRAGFSSTDRVFAGIAGRLLPIIASIVAFIFTVYILYEPYAAAGFVVPVEWHVLGICTVVGVLFWFSSRNTAAKHTAEELESKLSY